MRDRLEPPSAIEQLVGGALDQPDPPPLADYPGVRDRAAIDAVRRCLNDRHYVETATPDQLRLDREALVAALDRRDAEELVAQNDGTFTADHTTYTAKVARDGTVTLHDKPGVGLGSIGDPYASAKLGFLDRTRDQRIEVGKIYRREQLARSVELMTANLDRLWATTTDLATRKELVFELWDDCAETGDDDVVDAGAAARAALARYVQVKLRGADRYTASELARLNTHRQSKAVFDPYRDP